MIPGVRSFLTWDCTDSVGKIAEGAFFRIQRLSERLNDLLSRAAKSPSRKRRNMARAANRLLTGFLIFILRFFSPNWCSSDQIAGRNIFAGVMAPAS